GINLNEKELKKLLERMGHNYSKELVEIPSWRTDILHEIDLVEDVAIAYGYENFVPEIPKISTIGKEDKKEIIKRKISEILSGLNMIEVSNYHLTNKKEQFIKMGIQEKKEKRFIEVEESKTEYNLLRKDLTHYLLKNISENIDSEYPQNIFETGKIFKTENEKIHEEENLCVVITPGNFTQIKQILEYLSRMINVKLELKETEEFPQHFIDGRVSDILLENKSIGFIGEIHPKILKNWKIKMPVALFEINLENIFKEIGKSHPK
ncbi:MAG: phenylalanine--tRNA ligase subunit beta, partial [Nanoarchaeota archaeon]|nr:phenylalanine--tRNA ligase subunit beta [Nanoarchaeota archaeon]